MGYTSTMNPSFSHKTLLFNKNQSFFSHKSFMGTNIILKKARLVAPLQRALSACSVQMIYVLISQKKI